MFAWYVVEYQPDIRDVAKKVCSLEDMIAGAWVLRLEQPTWPQNESPTKPKYRYSWQVQTNIAIQHSKHFWQDHLGSSLSPGALGPSKNIPTLCNPVVCNLYREPATTASEQAGRATPTRGDMLVWSIFKRGPQLIRTLLLLVEGLSSDKTGRWWLLSAGTDKL